MKSLSLLIFLLLFVSSCSSTIAKKQTIPNSIEVTQNDSIEFLALASQEQKLVNKDLTLNSTVAKNLYQKSILFTTEYPKSKHLEQTLTIAAKCADGLNLIEENIKLIDQLLLLFPSSPDAPIYLYNKGKIFEEKLNNKTQALTIYKELVTTYPENKLSFEIAQYITFLSKTEEEQLNFLNKNND